MGESGPKLEHLEAIFFLILVRHVPHKNDDRYHVSRVWARVIYGEDVDRPLAPRHRPDGHEIPSGKHTKSIKKLLKIAIYSEFSH